MRLCFTLQSTRKIIPFAYQHELVRAFHRHLPNNSIHDDISLYSLSWLRGGIKKENGFFFPKSVQWDLSFYDNNLAKEFLVGILKDKDIAFGMTVENVSVKEPPQYENMTRFLLQSPVLLKNRVENNIRHIIYNQPEADFLLTTTMKAKLSRAGLNTDIKLSFEKDFHGAKTNLVDIKGVKNRASFCPVIAEGTPEALAFAWSVGLGHSTGSGFGAIL